MKNVKEIEFKVEGKKWDDLLDKAFKKKSKDTQVDGFRKGNCPKEVFIKKFGIESLYMEASEIALDEAYKDVIAENKLHPVCPGKVDITSVNEKGITYKFTIIEKPEVKLGKYTKLGVKKEKVEVTEEEVNHEIEHLRSHYADVVEETEGEALKGDTAVIDFEGFVDGEKLEGGSGANYPLELGTNTFIPGFEDGVIGMKVGEEKELNLKFPEDYVENLKGKDVLFKVKLNLIKKRVLPEIDEEFFKDLGYDDVKDEAGLKEKVKADLLTHKEEDAENKYLDELIGKAVENLEVEINPEIIEDEKERMIDDYRRELSMQGISLEQYLEFTKGNLETLKKNIEPQAIARIKTRYLLEGVVEKENLTVTDDEVKAEVKRLAEMYGTTEEEITTHIGDSEVIGYDLKMRKALDFLKEN